MNRNFNVSMLFLGALVIFTNISIEAANGNRRSLSPHAPTNQSASNSQHELLPFIRQTAASTTRNQPNELTVRQRRELVPLYKNDQDRQIALKQHQDMLAQEENERAALTEKNQTAITTFTQKTKFLSQELTTAQQSMKQNFVVTGEMLNSIRSQFFAFIEQINSEFDLAYQQIDQLREQDRMDKDLIASLRKTKQAAIQARNELEKMMTQEFDTATTQEALQTIRILPQKQEEILKLLQNTQAQVRAATSTPGLTAHSPFEE